MSDEARRLALELEAAQARIAELEAELALSQGILELVPAIVWLVGRDGRILAANRAAAEKLGRPRAELLGKTAFDLFPSEQAAKFSAANAQVLETGVPLLGIVEEFRAGDGETRWARTAKVPYLGPEGSRLGVVIVVEDITDLKRTLRSLGKVEQRLELTTESSGVAIWEYDCVANRVTRSANHDRLYGLEPQEAWTIETFSEAVHPDDRERCLQAVEESFQPGGPDRYQFDYRVVWPDGTVRWLSVTSQIVKRDEAGRATVTQGCLVDTTDRVRAEEQLRQSQKLEALGTLAGGVAHDFNNLLLVILCSADLAQACQDPAQLEEFLSAISRAAQSGAGLTQQLLAFGRKQIQSPKEVDLGQLVRDTSKMLRRILGEDIRVQLESAPDLGQVFVDPGQFTQVVMNLVVNARDAMPRGGELRIETQNLTLERSEVEGCQPGPYVVLSVSDTGEGIDSQTLPHVFEPFYTTKPSGEGTGLGLATVYGIVQQSGGQITVESRPGERTTFRIFLPRYDEQGEQAPAAPTPEIGEARGTETILLVEDEAAIATLLEANLSRLGYTVLRSSDGSRANALAAEFEGEIHLLLTDVVMPGESGPTVAERLRATRPTTQVLYMSGYPDDSVLNHGLGEGLRLLRKPFSLPELAEAVRGALDAG